MIFEGESMKRLGIYFFYDKDGIVDKYVTYFLDDLKKNLDELIIVCNGSMSEDNLTKISTYTKNILIRENIGFDVWAYKESLELLGWEKLCEFGEIVILNSTIMGPIYPLEIMFGEMSGKELDFWGMNKHYGVPFDPFGCSPYGCIPDHLQSHFLVFRSSLVQSPCFQKFWDEMPMINSYKESVGLFESYLTRYFEEQGFLWDAYVDTDDLRQETIYPLMIFPKELIENRKCPVFKRRSFFQPYDYMLWHTTGEPTVELYNYLKEEKLYDVDLIWNNILRTCNQSEYAKVLHLNYTVPSNSLLESSLGDNSPTVLLCMYLCDEHFFEEALGYAKAMPEFADVILFTNDEKKKVLLENYFKLLKINKLEIRVNKELELENMLLSDMKEDVGKYQYVCWVNDKYKIQGAYDSVNISERYKKFKNIVYNEKFVQNVLQIFETNPRLGILFPTPPSQGTYFGENVRKWSTDYERIRGISEKLEFTISVVKELEPFGPKDHFFWFRPNALKLLTEKCKENMLDTYIYSLASQQSGFYTAALMSESFAKIEYTNNTYYLNEYNQLFAKFGILDRQEAMLSEIERRFNQKTQKGFARRTLSRVKNRIKRSTIFKVFLEKQ